MVWKKNEKERQSERERMKVKVHAKSALNLYRDIFYSFSGNDLVEPNSMTCGLQQ